MIDATVPTPTTDDQRLVARLRAGDEDAFAALVDLHGPALLRAAMAFVPSRAVAEEVVQETWIAVMRGIDGFQGRSSLKTWIFRILTNAAMRGGSRERRSVPFAAVAAADEAVGRSGPVPFRRPRALPGALGARSGALAHPRGGVALRRDARGDRRRDRAVADGAAHGARPARHRRLELRGGRRSARDLGREPAHTAPPCARSGARRDRGLLRRDRGDRL